MTTFYVGGVFVSYDKLVEVFGRPWLDNRKGSKTDAEWRFNDDRGRPVTIYNYKNGQNCLGPDAPPVPDIDYWHVGGAGPYAIEYVRSKLGISE